MKTVGQNIRALRKAKGWDLTECAKQLGITAAALSKLETGVTDINLSRLLQIANLHNVALDALFTDTPSPALQRDLRLQQANARIIELQQMIIQLQTELEAKHALTTSSST